MRKAALYKLVRKDGTEVNTGDVIRARDGETMKFDGIARVPDIDPETGQQDGPSGGKVAVKVGTRMDVYYPSVFDCKLVLRNPPA